MAQYSERIAAIAHEGGPQARPRRPRVEVLRQLHPRVLRWVIAGGPVHIPDILPTAVQAILETETDVVVVSEFSGTRRKSAFVPVADRLARSRKDGISVLVIGPTRTAIGDSGRLLGSMLRRVGRSASVWHGGVSRNRREAILERPPEALVLTPEALEGLLLRRSGRTDRLLAGVTCVVVDEAHVFAGSARLNHVTALLHRVEGIARVGSLRRIVLAAPSRPDPSWAGLVGRGGRPVTNIVSGASRSGQDIRVSCATGTTQIVREALVGASGRRTMIFTGDRATAARVREEVGLRAPLLSGTRCWPPPERLSREAFRELVARRRDETEPLLAVVPRWEDQLDLPGVTHVVHSSLPLSVSALRRSLTASRSRAARARVRIHLPPGGQVTERHSLEEDLVQAVAMAELAREGWSEPVRCSPDLRAIAHQILALLSERPARSRGSVLSVLADSGAFPGVAPALFEDTLESLVRRGLLRRDRDRLGLGNPGRRRVGSDRFASIARRAEEYTVMRDSRACGTIAIDSVLWIGMTVRITGGAWKIASVNDADRVVTVEAESDGTWTGADVATEVADGVRERMCALYGRDDAPDVLDPAGHDRIREARLRYRSLGLESRAILDRHGAAIAFPWVGDRSLRTLALMLRAHGLEAQADGMTLRVVGCSAARLRRSLRKVAEEAPGDPAALAAEVANPAMGAHADLLDRHLLMRDVAERRLDIQGAVAAATSLVFAG